ncbi:cysteine desulfurase [Mycobacterium tuberculosis]|nr:cysteine desulfurase [Mycobacterium tuberculosis]
MAYLDHAATTPMHPAAIEAMAAVQRTSAMRRRCTPAALGARRIEEARELIGTS